MSAFEKIAGYEKEKAELVDLVEIFNNRKKYIAKGATLPKGIIFYGEAGTGKTLFAEVMASECSLKQSKISLSESASEASICRQIRKAFVKAAKARVPTMIFFDELDKVLPNEDEEYYTDRSKTILAQLLTLIDGMETVNNIVFIATCNNYSSLPASITRPGRFDKKICLGLPDGKSRTEILRLYMESAPASFALKAESIASLTGGFSCAALKTLVNECLLRSDEANHVSEDLIRNKILEIKEETIPTERSEQSYVVDATRNVGAFIVSRNYSNSAYILTTEEHTVCNAFLDGVISGVESDCEDDDYDYDDDDDENETDSSPSRDFPFSKSDCLAAITALLGGYAAEEIIFNKIYDNLAENLSLADMILTGMAANGMLGLDLYYKDYRYPQISYPQSHLEKLHTAFSEIIEDCYQKAKALLRKNRDLIIALTASLVKQKSIEKKDCEAILSEFGGIQT